MESLRENIVEAMNKLISYDMVNRNINDVDFLKYCMMNRIEVEVLFNGLRGF